MTPREEYATKELSDLIRGFEGDIEFDAHSFAIKFGRSHARQELERRGRAILGTVVEHLREHPPAPGSDLRIAWGYLLSHIEADIDPGGSGPKAFRDTPGWIAWAERFAA